MNDLISRAAAIDAIVSGTIFETAEDLRKCAEKPGTCNGETWIGGANDAIHAIEDMEAVDAAPVVHGYWKGWTATHWNKRYNDYGDPEYVEHTYYSCSKCRRRTVIRENHCPNCGAKNTESGL